jgi:hypothetical protein
MVVSILAQVLSLQLFVEASGVIPVILILLVSSPHLVPQVDGMGCLIRRVVRGRRSSGSE